MCVQTDSMFEGAWSFEAILERLPAPGWTEVGLRGP